MFSKEQKAQLIEEFWSEFKYKCKQKFGKRHSWVLQKTGIKGLQLKFEVSRDSVAVILQCYASSQEKREWTYDILHQYYRVIADVAEEAPSWDKEGIAPELSEMPSCYYHIENVDYLQKKDWAKIHDFFMEYMPKLENAFLEIKDVLKVEIKELS